MRETGDVVLGNLIRLDTSRAHESAVTDRRWQMADGHPQFWGRTAVHRPGNRSLSVLDGGA